MILLIDDSCDLSARILTAVKLIDPSEIIVIDEKKPTMIGGLHDIMEMALAVCEVEMMTVTDIDDNAFDEPIFQRYQVRILSRKVRRNVTSQTARGPPDL